MKRTPPIGAKGIYQLIAPWSASTTVIYTCVAIRSFNDLYEQNIDPFEKYYAPKGLSKAVYDGDVLQKANIITLLSDDHKVIYVPDTYIQAFPEMGVAQYQRVVLSVDFGMLPDYVDLDQMEVEMATLGSDVIGKEPDVTLHIAPTSGTVTDEEHQSMEASRLANIVYRDTDRAKYLQQLSMTEDLITRLQTMEQILIDHNLI